MPTMEDPTNIQIHMIIQLIGKKTGSLIGVGKLIIMVMKSRNLNILRLQEN